MCEPYWQAHPIHDRSITCYVKGEIQVISLLWSDDMESQSFSTGKMAVTGRYTTRTLML